MLSEQQLAARHSGLGGSDAAPALGLSPYKSTLALFVEKRDRPEPAPEMLAAFRWGNKLEPLIRQEYCDVTKRTVHLPMETLRHKEHAFMLAHVDGITNDGRLFEAKTARTAEGWGTSGSDGVPHHYMLQLQHYMCVTGIPVADLAVLIGGSDFRIFEVREDPELQQLIVEGESEFWQLVEKNQPPPPDFDVDGPIIEKLFPGTDGKIIVADEGDLSYWRTYSHAVEFVKRYEAVAESTKAHLLFRLGNGARLIFPQAEVQLVRREVKRKEYVVPASSYIDSRFTKLKEVS